VSPLIEMIYSQNGTELKLFENAASVAPTGARSVKTELRERTKPPLGARWRKERALKMVRPLTVVLSSLLALILGWVASAFWHREAMIKPQDLDRKYVIEPRFNEVVTDIRNEGVDVDPERIHWLRMCLLDRTPERRILKIPYYRLSDLDAQVFLQIALDSARHEDERADALDVLSTICFGRQDVCRSIVARATALVEVNSNRLIDVLMLLQVVWMGKPDDQFAAKVCELGRDSETRSRLAELVEGHCWSSRPHNFIDIGAPGIDANTIPRRILHNGRVWNVSSGGFLPGPRGKPSPAKAPKRSTGGLLEHEGRTAVFRDIARNR